MKAKSKSRKKALRPLKVKPTWMRAIDNKHRSWHVKSDTMRASHELWREMMSP
jgi:hypothetical protein